MVLRRGWLTRYAAVATRIFINGYLPTHHSPNGTQNGGRWFGERSLLRPFNACGIISFALALRWTADIVVAVMCGIGPVLVVLSMRRYLRSRGYTATRGHITLTLIVCAATVGVIASDNALWTDSSSAGLFALLGVTILLTVPVLHAQDAAITAQVLLFTDTQLNNEALTDTKQNMGKVSFTVYTETLSQAVCAALILIVLTISATINNEGTLNAFNALSWKQHAAIFIAGAIISTTGGLTNIKGILLTRSAALLAWRYTTPLFSVISLIALASLQSTFTLDIVAWLFTPSLIVLLLGCVFVSFTSQRSQTRNE